MNKQKSSRPSSFQHELNHKKRNLKNKNFHKKSTKDEFLTKSHNKKTKLDDKNTNSDKDLSVNNSKPSQDKTFIQNLKKPFVKVKPSAPSLLKLHEKTQSSSKEKKELEDLKKSYRYLEAEFANFKKTSFKEIQTTRQYGTFNVFQELLVHVVNDFNRALEKEWKDSELKEFKKGVELIHQQLIQHLKKMNVEEINPKKGTLFDPLWHEVISSIEDNETTLNHIIQVCRKGYKLNGRLIQPAQVIVSSSTSS